MKKALFALLAIIAVPISLGAAQAQIATVILSNNQEKEVAISEMGPQPRLTFSIPDAPPDTEVKQCTLRVVPVPIVGTPPGDQDVTVLWGNNQVGGWSAYSKTAEPYVAKLRTPKEVCRPNSESVVTLKTESKLATWKYYGGGATSTANQPRLIVMYESPSRTTPARSGQSTDWKYERPASFFSSRLSQLSGELLANPVSYKGAVYFIAACPADPGRCLYRLASAGNVASWPLGFTIDKGSLAFATAWGRLQIITTDAVHSCDLKGSADEMVCDFSIKVGVTVNEKETPAMGPDGSLYFKNVKAAGSIVAYNPSLKEIWSTELKLTTASPIALSANGHYAYVLADIPVESRRMIALLRIDTATGETVRHEIAYCSSGSASCADDKKVRPLLLNFLRPAIESKVINGHIVDYVFVSGNTSDTGILQLVAFEQSAGPKVLWSRQGKLGAAPVLGVKDGNSLFAVQGGKLKRYPWYKKNSPHPDSDMKEEALAEGMADVTALLVDGGDSVYMLDASSALYAYQSTSKKMSLAQKISLAQKLGFNSAELKIDVINANFSSAELEIDFINAYEPIWNDRGSGVRRSVAFWRPTPAAGWHRVGHHVKEGYGIPTEATMVVKEKTRGALVRPTDYALIWNDAGSGAHRDGSVWRPVCAGGYRALGDVASGSHAKPSNNEVRCVRASALAAALPGGFIWNDADSGANRDFAAWGIQGPASDASYAYLSRGLFYGAASHARPANASVGVLSTVKMIKTHDDLARARLKSADLPKLLFTPDGALIGYDNTRVYDFSPNSGPTMSPSTLATETIYSAEHITAPAVAGVKKGDRVILKGNSIRLPNGFRWPIGATLKLQSVQQSQ